MNKFISDILATIPNHSAKIFEEKKLVRQHIQELKSHISEAQKQKDSDLVFSKIESMPQFQKAKVILLYWSTMDELPTRAFVEKWSAEKQMILPTVSGEELILKKYSLNGDMKAGALGIWEPDTLENYTGEVDLVIVPGIAFDHKRNRLGRGKGFYDRFFNQTNVIKWGVGFDFQLLDTIPVTFEDIKMDKIITPGKNIE